MPQAASVWNQWLRRNRLHQMMRYDGKLLRLDGVMHRPALSKAPRLWIHGTIYLLFFSYDLHVLCFIHIVNLYIYIYKYV